MVGRSRSFFWTAEDTCTGAQCLVAWDRVCTPKSAGGLGVKNLEIQNGCLLLKFAYKFLHSADLPWKNWILHHSPYPMHQTSHSTFLASIVKKHIHILRQISQCTIGNGRSTYFWLDRWLLPEPLATAFPAIFSHHLKQFDFVASVLQDGIENNLRNRLTSAASIELRSLSLLLQDVSLNTNNDDRRLMDGSRFTSKGAYAALSS